jgi:chorismate mutase
MLTPMRPPGSFKIARRHRLGHKNSRANPAVTPCRHLPLSDEDRSQRVLESLRNEILEGGGAGNLRIRRVFRSPREIYRLEFEIPEREYQRTTLLDRDALEELLETDEVRAIIGADTLEA